MYELVDVGGFSGKIPANLKSRSYKLGTDFMPDAVAKLFQPQAQAGAEREDEPAIRMPEAPKPRKPAKEQERPKATEKPKPVDPEMERAMRAARRIVFPEYRKAMGWGTDRPVKTFNGKEQEDRDEMERQAGLFQEDWDNFGRWRGRRRKELESRGEKLEPIYRKDKATGAVTVEKENLLRQFVDYLSWLAAERLRKRAEERQAAMIEEWERARDGDRGYGED